MYEVFYKNVYVHSATSYDAAERWIVRQVVLSDTWQSDYSTYPAGSRRQEA
jgi:hypothetical protein